MNTTELLERLVSNPSDYTVEDNGSEYRLYEQSKPYNLFCARHIEFRHILNCLYTLKTLLGKEVTTDYIDNVSSFFSMVESVCTYSCNYKLEKLMNNEYIKSDRYELTDLEKQIVITYYISIPKEIKSAGEDSEGCSYNAVEYSQV